MEQKQSYLSTVVKGDMNLYEVRIFMLIVEQAQTVIEGEKLKDILWYVSKLKDKTFRVVPISEYFDEFPDCDLNWYDVCVEFKKGDYSEQYLLWDIDHYKD